MLSPRWAKIMRELREYKSRTVLVVLSIAVGVFAVGMIAGTQVALSGELAETYAATSPASARIYIEPFDDDLVQAVRAMSEVREAEGRRTVTVRAEVRPGEWRDLRLFVIPNFGNIRTGKVWPYGGDWPPASHEMLLERASSGFIRAGIGDTVRVKLPSGIERDLRVSGLAHDVSQLPSFFTGRGLGYITYDTLEWLGESRKYTELHTVVAGDKYDKAYIKRVADSVRAKVEKSGRTVSSVWIPEPGKHPADNVIQAMLLLLGVLGALALVLSGFLVVNTISALLLQQVRQIGVMKTVGARTNQVMGMYLGVVLFYGVLSLGIGVPLGLLGAYGLTSYAAGLLNFDLASFRVTPQVLALEVAVGLIVPLTASLYPIIAGVRVTVREALNSYGLSEGKTGSSRVDRLIERLSNTFWLLPRPLLLSMHNTFRRKGRLMLTLTTLTLGGAIFIGVFSVRASTVQTLDDALDYWRYDVEVRFSRPIRAEFIEHVASLAPGVSKVESWGTIGVRRIRSDNSESVGISMLAPPALTTMLRPFILQGRWLLPEDENAIVVNTDLLRDEADIKVGDDVVLRMEGRERTWKVVGIVRGILSSPTVYTNFSYFARLRRDLGRATMLVAETERHDEGFQFQVARELEERFTEAGLRVSGKQTTNAMRSFTQSQFDLIIMFLMIMAVLLAIVGSLGLMGTMSINTLERTREIGIMRAIGASGGAILHIIMVEGILIGVISWLLGVVLALPLSKLLSDAVGSAFVRAPLSYSFSISGVLLWLVLVVILSSLASFLPSWNASRLSVREVLAYE